MFNPLSVAAACSSKLNERQNPLRSASPQALFIRPPNGPSIPTSIPPLSSKKRSAMTVVWVGTAPKIARPVTTYSTACSAPASSSPHSSLSQLSAAVASVVNCPLESEAARGTKELIISRNSETCAESSSVRAGASPRQNGMVGGAPCASSTKTLPDETLRIRQEVLPSNMMSPAILSTANSSSPVPPTDPPPTAPPV